MRVCSWGGVAIAESLTPLPMFAPCLSLACRTSYSNPYSSGSSHSHTSSFWENAGTSSSRPYPENQSYSYAAWSTRGGGGFGSRVDEPWADSSEWEYVVDDEGFTEEELFENLFGSAMGGGAAGFASHSGQSKRGASAKRRGAAAAASSSAAAKKRAAAAERQRARDREAEQAAAEEAFEAAAAARSARNRAKRKEEKRAAAVPGSDLTLEIPLTFVEAAQGTVKTIQFQADGSCRACGGGGSKPNSSSACRSCNGRGVQNMRMPGHQSMHVECDRCGGTGTYETQCGTCHGSGHVKEKRTVEVQVPAGVDASSNIRLLNQGHSGRRGGPHGHLLLKAIIAPHPIFKRVGYDLHSEHTLPLTTALLGGVAQVPGLDGSIHSVRIEQGTQHLTTRALPGRGIKILDKLPKGGISSTGAPGSYIMRGGHAYGSQQVTWRIELPRDLSPKSKDLLKQLALEMGNIQNIDLTTDIRKQSMAAAAAKKEAAAAAAAATADAPATARASAAPANGDTFASPASTSTASSATSRAQSIPAGSAAAAAAVAASAAASGAATDNTTAFTRARSGPAAARRAAGAARAAARVSAAFADSPPAAATAGASTATAAASSASSPSSSTSSPAAAAAASRDVEDEDFLSGASAATAPVDVDAVEDEEDVPRLQDKRKYKRQLKKASKSKEHRRTLHLDPISVSARRVYETEESKYTQKQSVYNDRAAAARGDRL